MSPLIPPTIHSNGTSKQELLKQLLAVADAARVLQTALREAMPNARDYYPQGDGVATQAREAWAERMMAVNALCDEVMEQALRVTLG